MTRSYRFSEVRDWWWTLAHAVARLPSLTCLCLVLLFCPAVKTDRVASCYRVIRLCIGVAVVFSCIAIVS